MRLRTATALLLCSAAALAASGCGAGASATLDPVAQAADATVISGGAHLAVTMTMNFNGADGLTSPITMTGQGDMNLARGEGQVVMNVGGLADLSHGAVPPGTTMTELFTRGAVYLGSSMLSGKLPNGASWIEINLGKMAGELGLEPQAMTSGESNPAQFLQYLKAVGASVRAAGSTTVRGVATTRYTGSIDMSEAAMLLPSRDRAATEAADAKLIEHMTSPDLPVEVWVDAHHMVRKLAMSFGLQDEGHDIDFTIGEELFGFGPTPAVNPPAASETYELPTSGLAGLS